VIDIDYAIAEIVAAPGGIALVELDRIPPGNDINVVRLKE
jgi:hypothetical protein